jgi:DNA-binding NtrC family response regulator
MLVEYFVQRYAKRAGKNIRSIDKKTLGLLQAYDWPGNIRELQNVIEGGLVLAGEGIIGVAEQAGVKIGIGFGQWKYGLPEPDLLCRSARSASKPVAHSAASDS